MNMSPLEISLPRRRFLRTSAAGMALMATIPLSWAAGLQPGDTLPDLKSLQLEGTVPDLSGKVVHLDFWASWCVPCRKSFPVLENLHQTYGSKGYVLIGVSMDERQPDMDRFLKKNPGKAGLQGSPSRNADLLFFRTGGASRFGASQVRRGSYPQEVR
jgi:thiol-disulfide isomerase/thioredoxin